MRRGPHPQEYFPGDWPSGVNGLDVLFHSHLEGYSKNCHWRGYLQLGGYAPSTVLGCTAKSFASEPFRGSYYDLPINAVETTAWGDTFRRAPAYIWYGPGACYMHRIAEETQSHVQTAAWGHDGCRQFTGPGPLLVCPTIQTAYVGGVHSWQNPHRPRKYTYVDGTYTAATLPYVLNVGLNDGSVRFFQGIGGLDPM